METKILVLYSPDVEDKLPGINQIIDILRKRDKHIQIDLKERKKTNLYPSEVSTYSELYIFCKKVDLFMDFIKIVPKVYLYFFGIDKITEYRRQIEKQCEKSIGGKELHFRSLENV